MSESESQRLARVAINVLAGRTPEEARALHLLAEVHWAQIAEKDTTRQGEALAEAWAALEREQGQTENDHA
jgi:hypothetical protein